MVLITKEDKKAVIEHYNRMIAWAEKQDKINMPSPRIMRGAIGEWWGGDCCPLCLHCPACIFCPLGSTKQYCGNYNSYYNLMTKADTWKCWLFYAKKLRDYLSKMIEAKY